MYDDAINNPLAWLMLLVVALVLLLVFRSGNKSTTKEQPERKIVSGNAPPLLPQLQKSEEQQIIDAIRSLEKETKRVRQQCEKIKGLMYGLMIFILCLYLSNCAANLK
ncbi:MAG: hypothetical protein HZA93_19355 [Verrucomicrobia bacterium]|nr:hypothetical protein [Verrucomicrobiota bacterium]